MFGRELQPGISSVLREFEVGSSCFISGFHLNASAGLTSIITYGVILVIMDSNRASLLELGAK